MTWKPTKGTYEIDRIFPTVGRIRLRTGTHDKRRAQQYEAMLETLPLETVQLILDGTLELRVVWDAWSSGRMNEIPTAQALRPFIATMRAWAEHPPDAVSASETANRDLTAKKLERLQPDAKLLDAPVLLRTLREAMRDKASGFNHHRAALLAFFRDTVSPRSELYRQVADIPTLEMAAKFSRHPCTVAEARAIAGVLGPKWGPMWWAMCCSGMGPRELYVDGWKLLPSLGYEILGQKRRARHRIVPFVSTLEKPLGTMAGFAEALERADLGVTPYDARRSYARWLDEIDLPDYRQDAYLGHGPKGMTELYKFGQIRAWLSEDGIKLRDYLGERGALALSHGKA